VAADIAEPGDQLMSVDTISSEERKARKEHRCTWCGQMILIGEKYRHERVRVDGDMNTNDMHLECDEALAELCRYEGGACYFDPYENERPSQRTP
jgi:hypothetical protein